MWIWRVVREEKMAYEDNTLWIQCIFNVRHEELKVMLDKTYLTVCPPLSYEKEIEHAHVYIQTEKNIWRNKSK